MPVEARFLQVAIGFLLLFGLATRLVAAVGLVVGAGRYSLDASLLPALRRRLDPDVGADPGHGPAAD